MQLTEHLITIKINNAYHYIKEFNLKKYSVGRIIVTTLTNTTIFVKLYLKKMASHWQKLIFMVFILISIRIPISTGDEERSRRLEDLCSDTKRSNECRTILRSELNRFQNSDSRTFAGGAAELAIAKFKEIYDKIYQYHSDCRDNRLKAKYLSCAINYYDASCNLELARRILDFDEFPNISDEVDDAEEELMNCRRELAEESLDPSRVGVLKEDIGLYLDMVRAAAGRIPNDEDGEAEAVVI